MVVADVGLFGYFLMGLQLGLWVFFGWFVHGYLLGLWWVYGHDGCCVVVTGFFYLQFFLMGCGWVCGQFTGWYLLGFWWVWVHGSWCVEVVWMRGWLLCGGVAERVTERQKLEMSGR